MTGPSHASLDGWRQRVEQRDWADTPPAEAFDYAVRELAAQLRQGDFLPSGIFYRETTADRTAPDAVARD